MGYQCDIGFGHFELSRLYVLGQELKQVILPQIKQKYVLWLKIGCKLLLLIKKCYCIIIVYNIYRISYHYEQM